MGKVVRWDGLTDGKLVEDWYKNGKGLLSKRSWAIGYSNLIGNGATPGAIGFRLHKLINKDEDVD
jgi:hypothetical protein